VKKKMSRLKNIQKELAKTFNNNPEFQKFSRNGNNALKGINKSHKLMKEN
jgi:endonuclease III-like uncharacterized protein